MHFRKFAEKSHVCDSKLKLRTFCFQHWHEFCSIGDCQSVNFMKFTDILVNFQIPWLFPGSVATLFTVYIKSIGIMNIFYNWCLTDLHIFESPEQAFIIFRRCPSVCNKFWGHFSSKTNMQFHRTLVALRLTGTD